MDKLEGTVFAARYLFCIKMPQRLQQSFQKLIDAIPYSVMSSGTTTKVMLMFSFEIRHLLNGFINCYITWNALASFFNISLTFLYSSSMTSSFHWNWDIRSILEHTFKKINNENRKFEEKVIKLKQNQQRLKFSKASAFVLNSLTLLM